MESHTEVTYVKQFRLQITMTNLLQREMLMIFMKLLQQGAIKPHFSVYDMIEYMICQKRETYMERSDRKTISFKMSKSARMRVYQRD